MPKRYPLYELSLRLYPKQFQRRYADQMVQTMADMLDDQPNKAARTLIWIRTGFNLALTIVQQNIMTLGENAVNKPAKPIFTYKRLSAVLAALLLLMLVAIHGRIQANVAAVAVRPFYTPGVAAALHKQNEALQEPIKRLYGNVPKAKNDCVSELTQGIHTEVGCQSTVEAYTKLAQGSAGRQAAQTNVSAIEAALAANGYEHGRNAVTLTSLVMGTYDGKSNSPDAFYERVSGSYDCVFDTTVAYADPAPPAIHTSFWCTRTIDVLGRPSHEYYRSDKGLAAPLAGYGAQAN